MHWACLLLPQLALDSVLRLQPDPQRPLVLLQGRRSAACCVRSARPRAQRAAPGHAAVGRAGAGAGHAPARLRPNAEQHTRQLLASWAYAYSSQVSLDFRMHWCWRSAPAAPCSVTG
jgi:protein ImuB